MISAGGERRRTWGVSDRQHDLSRLRLHDRFVDLVVRFENLVPQIFFHLTTTSLGSRDVP
jgi:hypothetical protein